MHSDARRFRHDLRNLLNSLRLALAAMDLEKDSQGRLYWLSAIERTADRGVEVINEYEPIQDRPEGTPE